jgi:hypothetical protein
MSECDAGQTRPAGPSLDNRGVYCLRAAIAAEPVLRDLADLLGGLHIVPLWQHLAMSPLTGAPIVGLQRVLAACSATGPVAHVEAGYFGGVGTQSATVWDGGTVALGPLYLAEGEPQPADGSPISRALRHLGASRGEHADEFDAVGLGRHRDTASWLPSQTE